MLKYFQAHVTKALISLLKLRLRPFYTQSWWSLVHIKHPISTDILFKCFLATVILIVPAYFPHSYFSQFHHNSSKLLDFCIMLDA